MTGFGEVYRKRFLLLSANVIYQSIQSLYAEMLQEVTTTANKMKGTTIETEKKQFANMQNTFDTIVKDIKAYSTFLTQAAESYEAAEREGTQKAQEQGKVF